MFIYILAHDCKYKEDLEDMVCVIATDFQKVLDYLTVDRVTYLNDFDEMDAPPADDFDEDSPIIYEPTLAAKANLIVRRLVETGWIVIDTDIKFYRFFVKITLISKFY